jgi:hypothetical protein
MASYAVYNQLPYVIQMIINFYNEIIFGEFTLTRQAKRIVPMIKSDRYIIKVSVFQLHLLPHLDYGNRIWGVPVLLNAGVRKCSRLGLGLFVDGIVGTACKHSHLPQN